MKKKISNNQSVSNELNRNEETHKIRCLKLQPFYRRKTWGEITVTSQLLLCGNWLKKAGFLPENYVKVIVREGLLVIQANTNL